MAGDTVPSHGEIGTLFRDLRRLLRLSLPDIAHRLGTRIDVLVALETGDVDQLPPWPETARVVTAYTGLAGIDPRPVLGLLRQEMARQAAPTPPNQGRGKRLRDRGASEGPSAWRGAMAGVSGLWRTAAAHLSASWRAFSARFDRLPAVARAAAAIALIVGLGGLAMRGPMTQGAFGALNAPMSRLWRAAEDFWVTRSAPVREGLRWIEVDDPRSRRGDKLAPGRSPERR